MKSMRKCRKSNQRWLGSERPTRMIRLGCSRRSCCSTRGERSTPWAGVFLCWSRSLFYCPIYALSKCNWDEACSLLLVDQGSFCERPDLYYPLIMGATMVLQQKMTPTSADTNSSQDVYAHADYGLPSYFSVFPPGWSSIGWSIMSYRLPPIL